MEATVTMQQIADVTGVQRAVVSMWRSRYADGDTAFPAPVKRRGSTFEFSASQIATWLQLSELGNNPHAAADLELHSSVMDAAVVDAEAASALLLITARTKGTAHDLEDIEAAHVAIGISDDRLLSIDDVANARERADLVPVVDTLSEAAFGAANVLPHLASRVQRNTEAITDELLTSDGRTLLASIVAELVRTSDRVVIPEGPGGLELVRAAAEMLSEAEQPVYGCADSRCASLADRVQWRTLLAADASIESVVQDSDDWAAGLVIAQWASATMDDADEFFDWLDDLTLQMGSGTLLLVGPASLLIDDLPPMRTSRRSLFLGTEGYVAPLRYTAPLTRGLLRSGSRKQLALWVLSRAEDDASAVTVYADHSEHKLNAFETQTLAADIAASVRGDRASSQHGYLRGTARNSGAMLTRGVMRVAPTSDSSLDGREVHARVWAADDQVDVPVLRGIELEAVQRDSKPKVRTWRSATTGVSRLARGLSGHQVPTELIAPMGPGRVAVIGPEELRGDALLDARGVDRLELERAAPRARFTHPNDVVYLPTKQRVAIVDRTGGHLVLSPARIVRCSDNIESDVQLVPHIVAEDITQQAGADTAGWVLRTVPTGQVEGLMRVQERIETRRAAIAAEAAALDAIQSELARGVAAGVLTTRITHSGATGSTDQQED
ncbi:hypothetical protein [Gordonia phthalatica]|uniref:DNA-binding protein n=1 Tax=Gordonia phthalatica TaxID=1136941 RepID=A0A0N7FV82_9ACTN|nr:hypothetical protein [Gordonia phthalatica]ALG86431.1 hypothetical protein ACH46_20460 [Gordonia phthalatica]